MPPWSGSVPRPSCGGEAGRRGRRGPGDQGPVRRGGRRPARRRLGGDLGSSDAAPHGHPHMVRGGGAPPGGPLEGMPYTTEMRFFAFRSTIDGEVLEWDPPKRSTIRLTGLLEATVTSTVEPLADGGSR